MDTKGNNYLQKAINDYFEAIINLLIFFPYFFSVTALLKTLFSPWKNLVTKKTSRGFSFTEVFNRAFFNLVSRCIGLSMRISILCFYLCLQILFILILPFITILFFVTLPISYFFTRFQKTEEEKKESMKTFFLQTHLLKEENRSIVTQWFELYYQKYLHKTHWWKLTNLFSYPPVGRDWAVGYTPILDEYTQELTSVEYQSHMKNIVGRKQELADMEQILIKNEQANILIVGEDGVGKHTVIDALAKQIYEGHINSLLAYKRILKLNLEKILTTYTDQKQRESFLEDLFEEAKDAKNVILLIENIDKYVSSGPDRVDLSLSFEKYGRQTKLQFIGITTPFFYQRFIFTNEKINRIFAKIDVSEVTSEETMRMSMEVVHLFEQRNDLYIPYETVRNTIDKGEFYITNIPFPEKAFDLLDNACAYYNQHHSIEQKKKELPILPPETIDTVLSEKTHIPTKLTDTMRQKLLDLETSLGSRVLFQSNAVNMLASAMRRSFILLGKRKKPLATFLFLGPTGVGKTETAKALADIFFGSEKYLVRFDMSLYQMKDTIKQLIGSIESGIPGLLSNAIRENPYAVLLLDEIEKADKDLLNIFLTLLDEGYFTDGFGKRVDCKNLIVIATSNAGSDYIFKQQNVLEKLRVSQSSIANPQPPVANPQSPIANLTDYLISNHLFSPEFLNRFDGVVEYNPITEQSTLELAKNMLATVKETLYKMYRIKISISDQTLQEMAKKGFNPAFGARNLERVLTQELEDRIAKLILEKKVTEGDTIEL